MDSFEKAMQFIYKSEGGTNSDPLDRGGFTQFGIAQKQYPDIDLVYITREDADLIYMEDYWFKNRCDNLPYPLNIVVMDSSVNCGVSSTAKWLQSCCNRCGSKLLLDGIIGSRTLAEVSKYNERTLLEGIIAYRLERYTTLIKRYPKQVKFIRGWVRRVSDLLYYVM